MRDSKIFGKLERGEKESLRERQEGFEDLLRDLKTD